jgi:RNA polymerase sigma factor (sigma-70 family)
MMTTKPPFDRVVTEHGETVLRVCRAVLGAHTDADDAWSETFLAALGAWPTLPVTANVEAWLVTIAHRKAIDITRTRSRHAIPVGDLPERASTLGIPDAGDLDLWAALATLPHKQRLAVAYHHLGGLPYRDVAELLGGSTDAARRAAADGMTSLRAILVEPPAALRPASAPAPASPTAFLSEETS